LTEMAHAPDAAGMALSSVSVIRNAWRRVRR
jgi:hypothetical protein